MCRIFFNRANFRNLQGWVGYLNRYLFPGWLLRITDQNFVLSHFHQKIEWGLITVPSKLFLLKTKYIFAWLDFCSYFDIPLYFWRITHLCQVKQYVRYRDFYHLQWQTTIFSFSAISRDFSKFPRKPRFNTSRD